MLRALAFALVVGACTADASVGSAEAPATPGRTAGAAAPPVDAIPSTTTAPVNVSPAPPTIVEPTGTIAAAPSGPSAAEADEADDAITCAATITELPQSTALDVEDRRLARGSAIVVSKSTRRLMLYDRGKLSLCFRVGLGFSPTGHKAVEGDGKTPEGWYRTSDKPWSTFENAIAIHYPNEVDARAAMTDGRIGRKTRDKIVAAAKAGGVPPQYTELGGAVLIHGGGGTTDWTLGCIALDDTDLVALRSALGRGMRADLLVLP